MQISRDAMLLRIFIGEDDKYQGRPLYETIVLQARELHLAGATVLRGPMGFGHSSRLHTAKILRLSEDLPIVIEIVDEEAKIKNFRWHDLRHTFASRLRMKGAPLEDIADLLGHKSLTMTRRYAHLGPNKLHAVVSLLGATATTAATSESGTKASTSQVVVQ